MDFQAPDQSPQDFNISPSDSKDTSKDISKQPTSPNRPPICSRKSGQHSSLAKTTLLKTTLTQSGGSPRQALSAPATPQVAIAEPSSYFPPGLLIPLTSEPDSASSMSSKSEINKQNLTVHRFSRNGVGPAASDTPQSSNPGSPGLLAKRLNSGASTPRMRPTTLDIPGLTSSKVSPDGRISQRDVGSKLVIVMVGLPARGKSYITRKIARYLNWLQHDTRIFNVGERRRVAASAPGKSVPVLSGPRAAANALMPELELPASMSEDKEDKQDDDEQIGHDANFFDPKNKRAAQIREQCAMDTLDELLDYILEGSGSVGILDATNSTLARRKMIMDRIRGSAGEVNVLFIESVCENKELLEANMMLKLSGPDYKGRDPEASLADFRKRVAIYEKNYVPLGEYEESNNMSYVKMIDVGRKMVSHQIRGFLSAQVIYYLVNFNLAPRQIWITRHGESTDNVAGRIGGDSELNDNGTRYAKALARFIVQMRADWEVHQRDKAQNTHLPPRPGDHTPPNPFVPGNKDGLEQQNFCVWTSMLRRSIQTAEFFDDDDFEVKQMRMLNELYAGNMEGMSFHEMQVEHADEWNLRQKDRLAYRYPGSGGEGYLDVIHRLRPVIVELERMTDHCLLITHRTCARILLGYFRGLSRDDVTNLYVPLGMLYMLEPKPYGVEFKAYRYDPDQDTFEHLPEYQLQRQTMQTVN